jgi:SAM-dependent methyltransferase
VNDFNYFDDVFSLADERFDLIYPMEVRALSWRHWTPVVIARQAAAFLADRPNTRVLDVGCGPGKFCIIGALTTAAHFTGVEQREGLASLARDAIQRLEIKSAQIVHANVTEIDFSAYDAFYLFNPFEENLFKWGQIDATVNLSRTLYDQYTNHVATELANAPLGTRVVTYGGLCEEVPLCYQCQRSAFAGMLKLWEKTRHAFDPEAARIARAERSQRSFLCELRDYFG